MTSNVQDNFTLSVLEKFRQISKEENDIKASTTDDSNSSSKDSKIVAGEQFSKKRTFVKSEGSREVFPSVKEEEVGITNYLSGHTGFTGILKHRFSDFQVNEIDCEGNVVKLTSFDLPEEKSEPVEVMMDVLTNEQWRQLNDIISSESSDDVLCIDVTDITKADRGQIHKTVKQVYGVKVNSNTEEENGIKYIKLSKRTVPEGRSQWPEGRGQFLHFTLHKNNLDMTQAVGILSDKLKVRPNFISYAGSKDKRAKTSQRMCVKKKTAEELSALEVRKMHFGNFCYKSNSLRLGDSKGNRFRIAIRDVKASDEEINECVRCVQQNGFINYFGLQRFGMAQTPTYMIGKAIIAGQWSKAIDLILQPKGYMRGNKLLALKQWALTKKASAAYGLLPKYDKSLEANILRSLKQAGDKSYITALLALPRNTMTIYLHSYQSVVWNKVMSKRMEVLGLQTAAGDLVIEEEIPIVDNDEQQEPLDAPDEHSVESFSEGERKKVKVRVLSAEEALVTPLTEVVYPLPGCDVTFPDNEVKNWYKEILAEDGFNLDSFNSKHKHFALGGSYRKIVAMMENLSWETVPYNSPNEDLILSDIDELNNVSLPTYNPDEESSNAMLISFSLGTCSFATMALRELMKCNTSVYHQANLTKAHTSDAKKPKTE